MGNARPARKLAVIADGNMADRTDLTGKDAVITGGYAAADADMRHNKAVFAQHVVMAEMHKVINLGACAHYRAACGCPVDAGIAADFDLVLQHHIAGLQNKAVLAGSFIGNVAKAVAADNSAGLQNNFVAVM